LAEGNTVLKIIFIKPLIALRGKFSDMRHHCGAAEGNQAEPEKGCK
jgi:hypothetical protein